jgi:acyl-CoA dehydrogenase
MNAPLMHDTVAPDGAQDMKASAPALLAAVDTEPGWRAAAQRAAVVAAQYADAVDRDARFPTEAFDALRDEKLLSAMVPAAFGGAGLSLAEIGAICEILAHG